MTDWADEAARELSEKVRERVYAARGQTWYKLDADKARTEVAAALRAAHEAGARDMRERAAGTAKVAWLTAPELEDGSLRNADQDMRLCDQIEAAIRALQPIPAPHDSEEQP